MKAKILTSMVVLSVLILSAQAFGDVFTVVVSGSGGYSNAPTSTNILVAADSVVEWGSVSCDVSVSLPISPGSTNFIPPIATRIGNNTAWDAGGGVRVIAGPALINISQSSAAGDPGFCTVRIAKQTGPFTPSTAVVIPSDAQGPVNILLESSTNLVDWVQALPGTYGTSSQVRYFRVRAVRK